MYGDASSHASTGLAGFLLQTPLGSCSFGSHVRARRVDEDFELELCVLSPAVVDRTLRKRLKLLQLLRAPAWRLPHELHLDDRPPHVVWKLEVSQPVAVGMALQPALLLAGQMAEALTDLHRLGLVMGRCTAESVRQRGDGHLCLDPSGLAPGFHADAEATIQAGPAGTQAADIESMGGWLRRLFKDWPEPLTPWHARMCGEDLDARPSAREVWEALRALPMVELDMTGQGRTEAQLECTELDEPRDVLSHAPGSPEPGAQLGRFRLHQRLGRGGMGEVFRAEDLADGTEVAIKTLIAGRQTHAGFLRRFRKEARLLAEVRNPYVANLLEVGEDHGIHFMVVELIDGTSLEEHMQTQERLPEDRALQLIADVARALVDPHRRGIVHRDIKPQNIMLARGGAVKLIDFGIARQLDQSASLAMTRTGDVIGSPLYMAPEQCEGAEQATPASDVYALTATLFRLLCGRPVFEGKSPLQVIMAQVSQPPPSPRELGVEVSEACTRLLERGLAKKAGERFGDASELLEAVEKALRQEPSEIHLHPRLPEHDPGQLLRFEFVWELRSRPAQLWPYVSNTDRMNRAVGLPAVDYVLEAGGGQRYQAQARLAGIKVAWKEHPYEWIEGRRYSVLREFDGGPLAWYMMVEELQPQPGGGTRLSMQLQLLPRSWWGRILARIQVGRRLKRRYEQIFQSIDGLLQAGEDASQAFVRDRLNGTQRRRLAERLQRLRRRGVAPELLEALSGYLSRAPAQDVARIRVLELARRLKLEPDPLVDACLLGCAEGLLEMYWDILCPSCQLPSQMRSSLRELAPQGRCEVCDLDFELDFAASVEWIVRVHPELRKSELRTFCIAGPGHAPHVVAQVRLQAGERFLLELQLERGAYQLRSHQLPEAFRFSVGEPSEASRLDLELGVLDDQVLPHRLSEERQVLALRNPRQTPLLLRVERRAAREDALTAAHVCALQRFGELFPGEQLAADQQLRVATVTLLALELGGVFALYAAEGDAGGFVQLQQALLGLRDEVAEAGGAMVKAVGSFALASFPDLHAALQAASRLMGVAALKPLGLKLGLHQGPAVVASPDGRLDYFGRGPALARLLPDLGAPGQLVCSPELAGAAPLRAWCAREGRRLDYARCPEGCAVPWVLRISEPLSSPSDTSRTGPASPEGGRYPG